MSLRRHDAPQRCTHSERGTQAAAKRAPQRPRRRCRRDSRSRRSCCCAGARAALRGTQTDAPPCRLLRKPRARNSSGCNRCPQRAAARYTVLGAWSRVRRAPPATSFLRASPAAVMRTAALRLAGRALRSRVGVPCELASLRSAEAACAPCSDRVSRTRLRDAPHGSRGFSASGAPPPPGGGGDSEPTPEEVRR
jgi:hypothetical protein